MRIEVFNNYNSEHREKVNPSSIIAQNFANIDEILQNLERYKLELMEDYLQTLNRILIEITKDYSINLELFTTADLKKRYSTISKYPEIQKLIINFTCNQLKVPQNSLTVTESVDSMQLDIIKSWNLLNYYRTLAFVELLGRTKGIAFWKEFLDFINTEWLKTNSGGIKGSMKDYIEKRVAIFSKSPGGDCKMVIYDDYRLLQNVTRCIVHESTKGLDQEIAYLSKCYEGQVIYEKTKNNRKILQRTTKYLYFDDYCDEFFWDNEKFPNCKQPSLDFTSKLGNE